MTLEEEVSLELVVLKEVRVPQLVVQPHLLEGNVRLGEPLRPHLLRLGDSAGEGPRLEDMNLQNNRISLELLLYQSNLLCNVKMC